MKSNKFLFIISILLILRYYVHPWILGIDEWNGCQGGTYVNLVVATLPLFSLFLHLKDILITDSMEGHTVSLFGHLLVPSSNLSTWPEPDYSRGNLSWNALPHLVDTADELPPHCGISVCDKENQKEAKVDLFFIGPSTHYSPFDWNCDWNDDLTRYLNREAIIPQQAAIFNHVARIFSPQIRQMTGFGYIAKDKGSELKRIQAANIAYSDTKKAFLYYLEHWNNNRPFILAGHSQGSEHLLRLLKDVISTNSTLKSKLVVAYLVGMPIYREVLQEMNIPYCKKNDDVGCVVSWQTYIDGADSSHFYFEPIDPRFRKLKLGEKPNMEILSSRVCTNPLSWKVNDEQYVGKEKNLGGMHVVQLFQNFLYFLGTSSNNSDPHARQTQRVREGLLPLKKHLVGARCINGSLYVDDPPYGETGSNPFYRIFPVWRFASFPASNLHPYDYNFFWNNIRTNALDRVNAFFD